VIYNLIVQSKITVSADAATNLLAGIQYETNNYIDQKTSADTFEAVASLLRLGARRKAGAFGDASVFGQKFGKGERNEQTSLHSDISPATAGKDNAGDKKIFDAVTDIKSDSEQEEQVNQESSLVKTVNKKSKIKKTNLPSQSAPNQLKLQGKQSRESSSLPIRPSRLTK
jgi:hypothetical protein